MRQVILYPGEIGYWVAECPSLPGCVSQGKTREEAIALLLLSRRWCGGSRRPSFVVWLSRCWDPDIRDRQEQRFHLGLGDVVNIDFDLDGAFHVSRVAHGFRNRTENVRLACFAIVRCLRWIVEAELGDILYFGFKLERDNVTLSISQVGSPQVNRSYRHFDYLTPFAIDIEPKVFKTIFESLFDLRLLALQQRIRVFDDCHAT